MCIRDRLRRIFILIFLTSRKIVRISSIIMMIPESIPRFSKMPLILLSLLTNGFEKIYDSFQFILGIIFNFNFTFVIFLSVNLDSGTCLLYTSRCV